MLENDYFTKDEVIEAMQRAADYSAHEADYSAYDFYDLLEAMFDRDFYFTDTHEASEAVATYKNNEDLDGYKTNFDGKIGAIELVERYELDHFGNILMPLVNEPEKLANMIEYIRGKTLFKQALTKANIDMFGATTKQKVKKFIEATKEL